MLSRLASALRREYAVVLLATGAVALHIADDNFLQPEPGTSASDHLASGLIPIAVLAAVAAIYPRLRAGVRAATAMTLGALAVTVGIPAVYYLLDGSASGDHYTGLLAIIAGAVLLRDRAGHALESQAHGRKPATPLSPAHARDRRRPVPGTGNRLVPRLPDRLRLHLRPHRQGAVTPELGVPYESVSVTTSDSLELAASYVPSQNGAAVVLYPGATRSDEARMLIRHGYGVLLLDPRGQGRARETPCAGPVTATCKPESSTCAGAPTSIPGASAGSASRSAVRCCWKSPPSRAASRRSSPRAPGAALATKSCRARRGYSPNRTWP